MTRGCPCLTTTRSRAHAADVDVPETQYARRGGDHIAYQTMGDGPPDIVLLSMWFSNVEASWDFSFTAAIQRRVASIGRLIGLACDHRLVRDRVDGDAVCFDVSGTHERAGALGLLGAPCARRTIRPACPSA